MDHCIFRFRAKAFPALGLVAMLGYLSLAILTTSFTFSQVPNSAPQEDFWQYTGVPTGRTDHLAVWTGTELIILRGWNIVSPPFSIRDPADAARYNPLLDKWTRLNQTNAPAPGGQAATAVWTGSEMIVWGGYAYDLNGAGLVIVGGVNRNGVPGDVVVYNPALPTLSITSADENTATIQWPFPTTGFRLQKTDDLSRPDWIDVQGEFSRHGANWLLNVNSTNRAFFQLSLPEHNSP